MRDVAANRPAGSLQAVGRASDTQSISVQHVRVDHCRAHIGVSEKLLNRTNVVPGLEQVCRKRVPVMPRAA